MIESEDLLLPFPVYDFNPACEFNAETLKSRKLFPWKKKSIIETCPRRSEWIVIVHIESCINHDHVILVCDIHRYAFNHNIIRDFSCCGKVPDVNYSVISIEKI